MLARLRLVAAAVCLLLCAAILLLWAHSYFYVDSYTYNSGQSLVYIGFLEGDVDIESVHPLPLAAGGWNSTAMRSVGMRPDFIAPLFKFSHRTRHIPLLPGQSPPPLQIEETILPLWSAFAPLAGFPVWMFLRNRRKESWTLGLRASSVIPTLRWRVGRFAIFSAVGAGCAALFGTMGYPMNGQFTGNRYSPELFVIPGIATILIVLTRRRIPWPQALLWIALEIAGFICFFQAVMDQMIYYLHRNSFLEPQMLDQILAAGAISFVFGATLLLLLQLRPQKRIPGLHCPQCGYCLIGLPTRRCAECGRPFTLEELGIDATALNPTGALQDRSIPV